MLTHFPDKPHTQNPCFLQEWDDKRSYICQQKVDGWRVIVIRDKEGGWHYYSRQNNSLAAEIDPALKAEVESLPIPPDSQIDGEWISRRACSIKYELPQMIFLFDVLRWKGLWMFNKVLKERDALVKSLFLEHHPEHVTTPVEAAPGKFAEFFEEQRTIPYSEGVVVKHLMSKMVADRRDCKKNDRWFKVKWRAGSSGETDIAAYQKDIRKLI